MPVKIQLMCVVCGAEKINLDQEVTKSCELCGTEFETDTTCRSGHFVCHMCRQKSARKTIIAHCLESPHSQPYPLTMELMKLPDVAMHGPEHHLLLSAALLTAYCNEMGKQADLPDFLSMANERSLGVPGGACGYWGVCGAAIGSGIYMSIITEANPFAEAEWRTTGQIAAHCADAISREGGPRCCKRDSFLSLMQAARYSNDVLGTHFSVPDHIHCAFYPNNEECKQLACPFFPAQK